MRNEPTIFLLSLQFLTRLPIPAATRFTPELLHASTRYYPLVGFLIGGICAAVFWVLSRFFPDFLALLLSMTAGLLLTGAFHEDGLADTFDAAGGGGDREQALAIMKDSRIGTYGTLALGMALAIRLSSLIAMPTDWTITALIIGQGVSRLSSVVAIATGNYARADGKAKPVAEGISGVSLAIASITCLAGLGAGSLVVPALALMAGLGGMVAGHTAIRLLTETKLRGYTGDTLGAVQQASEIGFYLGLVAWIS